MRHTRLKRYSSRSSSGFLHRRCRCTSRYRYWLNRYLQHRRCSACKKEVCRRRCTMSLYRYTYQVLQVLLFRTCFCPRNYRYRSDYYMFHYRSTHVRRSLSPRHCIAGPAPRSTSAQMQYDNLYQTAHMQRRLVRRARLLQGPERFWT